MNVLLDELVIGIDKIDPKNVDASRLERILRLLNRRCTGVILHLRFSAAVSKWVDNGGALPDSMSFVNGSLQAADGDQVTADEAAPPLVPRHKVLQVNFRLHSKAFMLTHNSRAFTPAVWSRYLAWVQEFHQRFGSTAWAACLEISEHATSAGTVYHLHAYFLWRDGVGIQLRDLDEVRFENVRPRVDCCIQVTNGQCPRFAALHGLWYVALKKAGTLEAATNYEAWRDYRPLTSWLTGLWDSGKLTHQQFLTLSARFRTGHAKRKRDALEVMVDEQERAVENLVQTELEELEAKNPLLTFNSYAIVDKYLASFTEARRRRPVLVLVGGTNTGKSLLGAHILTKLAGTLGLCGFVEVTVEGDENIDLSSLDTQRHGGVLLDGVGDALMLKQNREVLQGRPKICRGGRSATMKFSYPFTLCRRGIVVTMDLSARNLELFTTDHWLSDERNCLVLRLHAPAWRDGRSARLPAAPTPRERMASWTSTMLRDFLSGQDLVGPASQIHAQGVDGADFLELTLAVLTHEIKVTPFAAGKLLKVRDRFLA